MPKAGSKTPYLTQIGDRWYCSRAVPRPIQGRIGKKLWRVAAGSTLAEARRFLIGFLADTDAQIEKASIDKTEARLIDLRGKPAEEIFHDTLFSGGPEEAEALSALPPAATLTASQLVSLATSLKQPAPGTVKEWENCLRLLQEHRSNPFPLTVTPDEVRGFRDHLLKTYKVSTAKKVVRFLSALQELAMEEGHTTENPWKGSLKRVRNGARSEKAEVPPETWSLVQTLPAGNQTLFWLVAYTGLRITEALGLRKQDLNLQERVISVVPHDLRPLKNESSRRRIPIDERLLPLLENHYQQATDLLFLEHLSPTKRWNTPSFWQRRLGFGPHMLRHGVTTKLRMAGIGESVVASLLGHTPPSMTARYGEVPMETLREAVRRLEWP